MGLSWTEMLSFCVSHTWDSWCALQCLSNMQNEEEHCVGNRKVHASSAWTSGCAWCQKKRSPVVGLFGCECILLYIIKGSNESRSRNIIIRWQCDCSKSLGIWSWFLRPTVSMMGRGSSSMWLSWQTRRAMWRWLSIIRGWSPSWYFTWSARSQRTRKYLCSRAVANQV